MPRADALRAALGVLALATASAAAALYLRPPAMLRVGAGYAAKIVCSNVFLAGREAAVVLRDDVQAPGHPLLRAMRVSVERETGTVRAGLLGFFGRGLAVHRPGLGCATVPDGRLAAARGVSLPPQAAAAAPSLHAEIPWPAGTVPEVAPALAAVLADDALAGPGWRALAVVHGGHLVAERYVPGFSAQTPLLGWSMTKTVTAALVGMQVGRGHLSTGPTSLWPAADARAGIRLDDLLAMQSGLAWSEGYGGVSDVTRMLYLEPDMAGFARARPGLASAGQVWNYSSGTTLLLSRLWQDAAGADALAWPQRELFAPLGMASATLEADARGTFVGSSYMYATARDWARFGLFLLRDGVWEGKRLLPPGWVAAMQRATAASAGEYAHGQLWQRGPRGRHRPSESPDAPYALPADTYWLLGHDGQAIAIVPSHDLVLVRLGLTPASQGYQPQALLARLLAAASASAAPAPN